MCGSRYLLCIAALCAYVGCVYSMYSYLRRGLVILKVSVLSNVARKMYDSSGLKRLDLKYTNDKHVLVYIYEYVALFIRYDGIFHLGIENYIYETACRRFSRKSLPVGEKVKNPSRLSTVFLCIRAANFSTLLLSSSIVTYMEVCLSDENIHRRAYRYTRIDGGEERMHFVKRCVYLQMFYT